MNSKWVKTHKIVNFPFNDFDPTSYLASVPQETILRHRHLKNKKHTASSNKLTNQPLNSSKEEEITEDGFNNLSLRFA